SPSISQIKVFERPTNSELKNTGIFFESSTRQFISLNGTWEVSFNDGKNFANITVPVAYDFEGRAIFRKKFTIPEEMRAAYSFVFVAEGLSYESEIKINNNFVSSHTGAFTPVITALPDGIISGNNEIEIDLQSE